MWTVDSDDIDIGSIWQTVRARYTLCQIGLEPHKGPHEDYSTLEVLMYRSRG